MTMGGRAPRPRHWSTVVIEQGARAAAPAAEPPALAIRLGGDTAGLVEQEGTTRWTLDPEAATRGLSAASGPVACAGGAIALTLRRLHESGAGFDRIVFDDCASLALETIRMAAAGALGATACHLALGDGLAGPGAESSWPPPGFESRCAIDRTIAALSEADCAYAVTAGAAERARRLWAAYPRPYAAAAPVIAREAPARASPARAPSADSAEAPAVDFVIPHHDDAERLADALDSALACARPGDAILVVDDGSAPEQRRAAQRAAAARGARFLESAERGGPAAARRAGLEAGANPLVQFLDSDDMLAPEGIAAARRLMARNPAIDVLTGALERADDPSRLWFPADGRIWTAPFSNCAHCGWMARRARLDPAAFEARMLERFEDWETHVRLVASGLRVEMTPIVTYRARVRRGSRNRRDAGKREESWRRMQGALAPAILAGAADPERLAPLLVTGLDGGASADRREGLPLVAYKARYRILDRALGLLSGERRSAPGPAPSSESPAPLKAGSR